MLKFKGYTKCSNPFPQIYPFLMHTCLHDTTSIFAFTQSPPLSPPSSQYIQLKSLRPSLKKLLVDSLSSQFLHTHSLSLSLFGILASSPYFLFNYFVRIFYVHSITNPKKYISLINNLSLAKTLFPS